MFLVQVGDQCAAHVLGNRRYIDLVIFVVVAGGQGRALLERLNLGTIQLNSQEMNRRCFLFVGALEILVRYRADFFGAADLLPDIVFDTDQVAQHRASFFLIRKLDHECCLPVTAVRNQRIVCIQFLVEFRAGRRHDERRP